MMAKLANYLLLVPILLISLLPLRIIYLLSDFTAWLLRKIFRYRYDVALINISRSFPHMKYHQVQSVLKDFYRNFTDIFFEMIWSLRISRKKEYQRFQMENTGLFRSLYDRGSSAIIVTAHKANWEMIKPFNFLGLGFSEKDAVVIYKKMSNRVFDRMLKWIRGKGTSATLLESGDTVRFMINNSNKQHLYFLVADQNPFPGSQSHINFLNQPTLFINGPEKLSRKLNIPVVYMDVTRVERGKYRGTFELVEENPSLSDENKISMKFAELLEKSIRRDPSQWLWTHKRWKYTFTEQSN